jgi:hypothetical protein
MSHHTLCAAFVLKKVQKCGTFLKCETCKLQLKKNSANCQWFARLLVKETSGNQLYLSLFHNIMLKIFDLLMQDLLPQMSEDDITGVLLDLDTLNVTYNQVDGKVIDVNL